MYPKFRDLKQFLLIVTLTSEVLPSNLQLYTSLFVLTCRFYKVFGRYLLFVSGLDWTGFSFWVISWIGLDYDQWLVDLDWTQARIQGMGAGAGAHPWDGDSPLKIYHSIAFKHQFITRRPPLGEILYPPLGLDLFNSIHFIL